MDKKENTVVMSISIHPELKRRIEEFAESKNVSKSSCISILLNYGIDVVHEMAKIIREDKQRLFNYTLEKDGVRDFSLLT